MTLTKKDGTKVEREYEKPQYGGVYKYYRASSVLAFDEAYQPPWTTGNELSHTNEELLQGNKFMGAAGTHEVEWFVGGWIRESASLGALAESWEFPDDSTIIFHIRKGVRYALDPKSEASRLMNGREFVADDVVVNIKRIYFDIPSSTMYGMAGVTRPLEVYATDKYTVVVKSVKGQYGKTWEYLADWTRMFPPEVVKKYGDQNDWKNVVGTGPFMLTDYVPMSVVTWTRNPNYWMKDPIFPENQLPYIETMKEFVIPDKSTQVAAVRTAKVDVSLLQYWEDSASLKKTTPLLKFNSVPQSSYYGMGFRMDKPELPFKDIRVRRALLMAVNHQEIVDTYFGGQGNILNFKAMNLKIFENIYIPVGKLPPAADGFDNNLLYTYHPVEAKKLLTEAGYPNGFKTEVVVNAATQEYVDQMLMLKEYWMKNLNVDVFVDIKENAVASSMYQKKSFKEMLIWGRWGGEPYSMFMVRKDNMYDWALINDPKMDDYYLKLSALYFKEAERDVLMKEVNQYIISQVYYYVPPTGWYTYFWWPWVKNYDGDISLGVGNYYWQKYIWLDQGLKKSMGY